MYIFQLLYYINIDDMVIFKNRYKNLISLFKKKKKIFFILKKYRTLILRCIKNKYMLMK